MNHTIGRLARATLDLGVSPDGHLLADFVARRDEAAFAQLVRRHGPMVLAVCRRVLRHQQDAEDAFQATFLVLARKADDVWPRDAVGAWLHGVAYRVAMKARGVRARQARREHPLEDVPQAFADPPCPDLAGVLDRAIGKLPEVYRAAVVACDLEGRSRKDAAEQLGWKEGTLSGRLSRARQLLAARLKKAGLAVPFGAVLTNNTADALPVKLADAVARAALGSHAAGVSAPVAALTEGVVRSMFLVKTKMIAASVFAACVLGLGVWSASGQQGPGTTGGATAEQPTTKRVSVAVVPSDLDRMQQGEWVMGRPQLETINGGVPKSVLENIIQSAKREGTLTVRGGKMMFRPEAETSDTSTTSGGGDGTSTTTVTPRTFTIKLDPTQTPKHIDLTDEKGKVTKGIYLLEDQYFYLVLNSNGGRPKEFHKLLPQYEMRWVMWQPEPPEPKGAAVPRPPVEVGRFPLVLEYSQRFAAEMRAWKEPKTPAEFQLQLERILNRIDEMRILTEEARDAAAKAERLKRPGEQKEWLDRMLKHGYLNQAQYEREVRELREFERNQRTPSHNPPKVGPDEKALQGKWKIDRIWVNKGDDGSPLVAPGAQTELEFAGDKLLLPYRDSSAGPKTVVFTFAVDSSKTPREIDLIANGKPIGKGIYEFAGTTGLRFAVSQDGKRPATIERRGRDGVITFELTKTAADELPPTKNDEADERAKADVAKAQQHANLAELQVQHAQRKLAYARSELDIARKTAEDAAAQRAVFERALQEANAKLAAAQKGNVNAPAPATCTVHIRTQFAAEKVETIQLTGSDTVLDVIGKSADAAKLAPTASTWLLRGGKILPIDWVGITQHGVTTTNYQIMSGDKVFVQINVK